MNDRYWPKADIRQQVILIKTKCMTYKYDSETSETFQLKQELGKVKDELEMYKCYKTAYEARIGRLKEAQRQAHLQFKGVIYIED